MCIGVLGHKGWQYNKSNSILGHKGCYCYVSNGVLGHKRWQYNKCISILGHKGCYCYVSNGVLGHKRWQYNKCIIILGHKGSDCCVCIGVLGHKGWQSYVSIGREEHHMSLSQGGPHNGLICFILRWDEHKWHSMVISPTGRQRPNSGLMLAHRLRRWANINPELNRYLVWTDR